ncbi:uncharacterized protein LOC144790841 [Lissotriton helveticus]
MDRSNFSQIDTACQHVEKVQDPANATVTNVPPALAPAVINSNAGHLSAPQPAYDPDLQQAFDDFMEYIEAQDALNTVQNTSVPTGVPTSCQDVVKVQEAAHGSKEIPLKRKASTSKVGPLSKKGAAKRPLSEAAQKHAAEERSVAPLMDITTSVQNNGSGAKGVSRRVRQEKLSTYYTPSNTLNNQLQQSILHRGGVNTGGLPTNQASLKKKHRDSENLPNPLKRVKACKVFTDPQTEQLNMKKKTPEVLQEGQAKLLSPEKKSPSTPEPQASPLDLSIKKDAKPLNETYTTLSPKEVLVAPVGVEEASPPQPPKTSRLSRKHLKLKPGVPKLQLAETLSNPKATPDPPSVLKPQTVPNRITVHVEVHAPEQPPKPVVSVQAQPRVSTGDTAQPLEGPSTTISNSLEALRGLVDNIGRTPEAVYQGSLSTEGLQNTGNQAPHPTTDISTRPQDYNDTSSQSSYPLSPSTPPGAYDPTSPTAIHMYTPVSSPSANPVYSPVSSPAANPVYSPVASHVASTAANPVYSPVSSPMASTSANPVYSPVSSPVASTSANPVYSTVSKPEASPAANPAYSTVSSPVASTSANPVYSTVSKPEASTSASRVYRSVSIPWDMPVYRPVSNPAFEGCSIDGTGGLPPFIRPRKVCPPKQEQDGSVNTEDVLKTHTLSTTVPQLQDQRLKHISQHFTTDNT